MAAIIIETPGYPCGLSRRKVLRCKAKFCCERDRCHSSIRLVNNLFTARIFPNPGLSHCVRTREGDAPLVNVRVLSENHIRTGPRKGLGDLSGQPALPGVTMAHYDGSGWR